MGRRVALSLFVIALAPCIAGCDDGPPASRDPTRASASPGGRDAPGPADRDRRAPVSHRVSTGARLAEEIATPLGVDSAGVDPSPADARRVTAVFELSFEAYRSPEELAIVEPLAVQLFLDMVALARGGSEPAQGSCSGSSRA